MSSLPRIHPLMFFVLIVALLFACSYMGSWIRDRNAERAALHSSTFKTLEGALLALLGLLLGFTFSMAVSRYNDRKQGEVAEANAIASVWNRTATLQEPARTKEQELLRTYTQVRLGFLNAGTSQQRIYDDLAETTRLQSRIWSIAAADAEQHRDPVSAAYLASLDEAFATVERRTAAYENRIPLTAWALLLFIGAVSSGLVGVGIHRRSRLVRLLLPLVVAAAFAQTLDLDSPRAGLVKLKQRSMDRVAAQIAGPLPEPSVR
ncbi:hypothetical protein [Acidipila sp. EB88]|uniref:bestrophin-like domain n=1 Tax=Acidipila sp. EB88 TaxID=2305226 RepID=UPI000F5E3BC2|nr:hypothetical protein [Acidipila sp. EB88]RRA48149.1 hypothetical protein D1Y84_07475 [Acidipila sp. EB88]